MKCREVHDRITGLALAAYCKHSGQVPFGKVAIECDVATCIATDDQFAQSIADRAADVRVVMQHIYGLHNAFDPARNVGTLMLSQMLEDTIEVVDEISRKFDSGQRASFFGEGRVAVLPAARRCRYSRASLHDIVWPVSAIAVNRRSAVALKSSRCSCSRVFSAIASSMKLCAVVPARFAARATRDLSSSERRMVVVDMGIPPEGMLLM